MESGRSIGSGEGWSQDRAYKLEEWDVLKMEVLSVSVRALDVNL